LRDRGKGFGKGGQSFPLRLSTWGFGTVGRRRSTVDSGGEQKAGYKGMTGTREEGSTRRVEKSTLPRKKERRVLCRGRLNRQITKLILELRNFCSSGKHVRSQPRQGGHVVQSRRGLNELITMTRMARYGEEARQTRD